MRFARNWDPNRGGRSAVGRLNAADMASIQADLATMFHDIFREELTAGGYQLVAETGPHTLVVIPAIVGLNITAPGHDDRWSKPHLSNRVTNNADARRAIRIWAQALRNGLDSLYKPAN